MLLLSSCHSDEVQHKSEVNIFGGSETGFDEFKFSHDFYRKRQEKSGAKFIQSCGITLLHKRVGITATHCLGEGSESVNQMLQPQNEFRVRINGTLPLDKSAILKQLLTWKDKIKAQAENDINVLSQGLSLGYADYEVQKMYELIQNLDYPNELTLDQLQYISGIMVEESGVAIQKIKAYEGFGEYDKGALETPDLALVLLENHNYHVSTIRLTNTKVHNGEKLYISGFGARSQIDLEKASYDEPRLPLPQKWAWFTAERESLQHYYAYENPNWDFYFGALFNPEVYVQDKTHGLGCEGDSGTGIFRKWNEQYALVGVLSGVVYNSDEYGEPMECQNSEYSAMFNDISNGVINKWITDTTKAWGISL